jgi:protein-L-isoaspartate O-methyltransferase
MLSVAREDFIPRAYRDHAYEEIPLGGIALRSAASVDELRATG